MEDNGATINSFEGLLNNENLKRISDDLNQLSEQYTRTLDSYSKAVQESKDSNHHIREKRQADYRMKVSEAKSTFMAKKKKAIDFLNAARNEVEVYMYRKLPPVNCKPINPGQDGLNRVNALMKAICTRKIGFDNYEKLGGNGKYASADEALAEFNYYTAGMISYYESWELPDSVYATAPDNRDLDESMKKMEAELREKKNSLQAEVAVAKQELLEEANRVLSPTVDAAITQSLKNSAFGPVLPVDAYTDFARYFGYAAITYPFCNDVCDIIFKNLPSTYDFLNSCGIPQSGKPILVQSNKGLLIMTPNLVNAVLLAMSLQPISTYNVYAFDTIMHGTIFGKASSLLLKDRPTVLFKDELLGKLKELISDFSEINRKTSGETIEKYNSLNPSSMLDRPLIIMNVNVDAKEDEELRNMIEDMIQLAGMCGAIVIMGTESGASFIQNGCDSTYLEFCMRNLTDTEIDNFINEASKAPTIETKSSQVLGHSENAGYRDATEGIRIEIAKDELNAGKEIVIGEQNSFALISGAPGMGKSGTLLGIISYIATNYHPDDVEIWLADYMNASFTALADTKSPHVKLVGLSNDDLFTLGLLDHIAEVCEKRLEILRKAVSDGQISDTNITDYKRRFGANSMSRILLIVDEFHHMTDAIAAHNLAKQLENIIRDYRKAGFSCIFCSQEVTRGLRGGLTPIAQQFFKVRMAMGGTIEEVSGTMGNDIKLPPEIKDKIPYMKRGEIIFANTDTQELGLYHSIYAGQQECLDLLDKSREKLLQEGYTYDETDRICIIDDVHEDFNEEVIDKFESSQSHMEYVIPLYLGTSKGFDRYFHVNLELENNKSNLLMIGPNGDFLKKLCCAAIKSMYHINRHKVCIMAYEGATYREFYDYLNEAVGDKITILYDNDEIIAKLTELYKRGYISKIEDPKGYSDLILWIGFDKILRDYLRMMRESEDVQTESPVNGAYGQTTPGGSYDNMKDTEQAHSFFQDKMSHLLQGTENQNNASKGLQGQSGEANLKKAFMDYMKEACQKGCNNIFVFRNYQEYSDHKDVLDKNWFGHKIACGMDNEEISQYTGGLVSGTNDANTVLYTDGNLKTFFTPFN